MCLSKPQKVIRVEGGQAMIEFRGSRKLVGTINQDVKAGDYVLCQNGLVITKIPESKAREIMKEWADFS